MPIRVLPPGLVNRIAAGEVVERPASAVKELVENALDAGAKRVEVALRDGGRSHIAVSDDGGGMDAEELALAVERHATSKLQDDDLVDIRTLGFRGEALPSIGAVSRLTLTSRKRGADSAWTLTVEAGAKSGPAPASGGQGTRVEVRDLFYATPARLKFLKAAASEQAAAIDAVKRLAMAHPDVAFAVAALGDGPPRNLLRLAARLPDLASGDGQEAARLARLGDLLGQDFSDNAMTVRAERNGLRLVGFAALPTLNRATAQLQYLCVNGRPVRDRLLAGAVRAAYQEFLARDRHPIVALFLDLPAEQVDVNVHPAKTEVRFRDAALVRGLIVGALRHALAEAGHRAATTGGAAAVEMLRQAAGGPGRWPAGPGRDAHPARGMAEAARAFQAPVGTSGGGAAGVLDLQAAPSARAPVTGEQRPPATGDEHPLGAACAQLHGTYVIAQTADGIVIVDQHAAHERLVMERMKTGLAGSGVARQMLLIPEVVELGEDHAARLAARAPELAALGLELEGFGRDAVVVRATPALLGQVDAQGLVRDLAEELAEIGDGLALRERIDGICASMACHGSVRAGRALSVPEMNALLRQMEATPHSGQCNHGRPTYVELKLGDIERLFGRS
ncbi:MAG: DNA mismatch repair endonuclease MutL [Alphaproteobacteria bacterium]|nr:DNA mismatch repair endonuclease MutL [Alphaproteobacteria bacterium]